MLAVVYSKCLLCILVGIVIVTLVEFALRELHILVMQVALIAAARCGRHLRIVVFHAGAAGQSKDAGQGDCAFDNRIHTRPSPLHSIAMTIAPSRPLSHQPLPLPAGRRPGPGGYPRDT